MSIAAASILAKTYRDECMQNYHLKYPEYKWNQNKGYPTLQHRKAIQKYGITEYHRKTFSVKPVQQLVLFLSLIHIYLESTEFWEDIENIPTTQFYRVAYNPHLPDQYYGGAQDNGTTGGNSSFINEWPRIYGGDGFQMVFHPEDPDIFYVSTQNGNINITPVSYTHLSTLVPNF